MLPESATETVVRIEPLYHVILLNDDDHSFEYVIEMLRRIFGYPAQRGMLMAVEVHTLGRVVLATTSREKALARQTQIHAYGPDWRIPRCAGSMTAVVEPAEGV